VVGRTPRRISLLPHAADRRVRRYLITDPAAFGAHCAKREADEQADEAAGAKATQEANVAAAAYPPWRWAFLGEIKRDFLTERAKINLTLEV